MKRRVVLSAIVIGMLFVLAGFVAMAASAGSGGNGQTSAAVPDDYAVVELADSPVSEYAGGIAGFLATQPLHGHKLELASANVVKYEAYLSIRHASFQAWLKSNAPWATVVREYSLVFNGFAVQLNGNSINALTNAPGVKSVTPDWIYYPTMDVSPDIIHAPDVWAALTPPADPRNGHYGDLSSIHVGVIDSGIDASSPFIVSPGCRAASDIVHDVFFSGAGLFDASRLLDNPHGTHVSGTIGGCMVNGPVNVVGGISLNLIGPMTGVAPGVTLHDYNVFPGFGAAFVHHLGGAFSHDIIAAVEKAVSDGMDVINLSIGGNVQGPHDTLAMAIDAAVDAGTVAVVAAGNAGPGILTVESPGNAANAITAGASTNRHFMGIPVTVGALTFGAVVGQFGNFVPPVSGVLATTTPNTGCTAIAEDLTGKIAVIDRGTCTFGTKIQNAQNKGATAVIIANTATGGDPIIMAQDGVNHPTIQAVMVTFDDGTTLKSKAGSSATIDGSTHTEAVTNNQDFLASFSSRGPTPYDFRIKPDVVAPGVNVLSSVFNQEFDWFQGTSMATPHTTGSVALLIAAHPGWSPAEIKSALVNTADRVVKGATSLDGAVGPLAYGGGRVNVFSAMNAPVTISPSSVSFGLFLGGQAAIGSTQLTVMPEGFTGTCAVSVKPGNPAWTFVAAAPTSVSFPSGTNPTITVTLNGATAPAFGSLYGDVVLTCGSTILRVPWWFGVSRGNGFLNGNQNSPSGGLSGTDPAAALIPELIAVPSQL